MKRKLTKGISLMGAFLALVLLIGQTTASAGTPRQQHTTSRMVAYEGAEVSNGTVTLGIADLGQLIDGTVGLRYEPTGYDAILQGCWCEGWGVADAGSGDTGWAYGDSSNYLSLESYTSSTTATQSVVVAFDRLRVTHDYEPSPVTPNLYEVRVTIENISDATISDLRYSRSLDWDIDFYEYVTVQGMGTAPNLIYTDNNGFQTPDPLELRESLGATGNFVDFGPDDHGALFDFGFGSLESGASKSFFLYYGAAGNEDDALAALSAVDADAYSIASPGQYSDGSPANPTLGDPNTYIFGYADEGTYSQEPLIVYFALGDSIASGHGLLGEDGTYCHRSPRAYPYKVAQMLEARYEDVQFYHLACSGATAERPSKSELKQDRYKWIRNQVTDTLSAINDLPSDIPVLVSVNIGLNDFEWTNIPNMLVQMAKGDPKFFNWVSSRTSIVAAELRLQLEQLLAKPNVAIVISEAYNPFNEESRIFFGIGRKGCLNAIGNFWSCYDRSEVAIDDLNNAYTLDVWVPLGRPDRLRVTTGINDSFKGHESPRTACGGAAPDVSDTWIQYFGDPNSVSEMPKAIRKQWGNVDAKGDCFHPNEAGATRIADGVNDKAISMGW